MLQSVFKLHKEYGVPLNECVNFVTLAPAMAVGIDNSTGSIKEGNAADLILVDATNCYPRMVAAVKNGKVACALNYAESA